MAVRAYKAYAEVTYQSNAWPSKGQYSYGDQPAKCQRNYWKQNCSDQRMAIYKCVHLNCCSSARP